MMEDGLEYNEQEQTGEGGPMKSGVFTQLDQLFNTNSVAQYYFTSNGSQHQRQWKKTWKMRKMTRKSQGSQVKSGVVTQLNQ